MRRLLAVLCLCTLAMNAAVNAQDAPRLGETIDVSIANVDVFVTDRDGNRVRGLTRADFEIYENGKRKEISNFAEYVSPANDERVGVDGAAAVDSVPRQKRTILIFLEQANMPKHWADPLVAELKNVIRKTIEPGDGVSIVSWSRYAGTTHLEVTEDLSAVNEALDEFGRSLLRVQVNMNDAEQLHEEAAAVREFVRLAEAAAGGGAALSSDAAEWAATLPMLSSYGEMKVRVAAITSAIHSIAGIEGKKVLLLLPRHLGEVAGHEFADVSQSPLGAGIRQRFGTAQIMQELVDTANASGVTIYPLYAMPPTDQYANLLNEGFSMRKIAEQTGGLTAQSTKDVIELLPRIASDVTDYYSLAYRVENSGKDIARDIVVKTRNGDYKVRARRQLVEKSDETRMRDRLRATLFRASHDSPIAIEAQVGRAKGRKTQTVPLRIRIPIAALTVIPQDPGKHAGSFSVHVGTAADLDELSDVTRKTQPFELDDKNLAAAQAGFFTYDLDVKVNAKARYLAVGVFDEVSKDYGLVRVDLRPADGPGR
ncbi:MAG TPA: VWA domain-containing protein [Thermoanaerobaculia bacterium]